MLKEIIIFDTHNPTALLKFWDDWFVSSVSTYVYLSDECKIPFTATMQAKNISVLTVSEENCPGHQKSQTSKSQ